MVKWGIGEDWTASGFSYFVPKWCHFSKWLEPILAQNPKKPAGLSGGSPPTRPAGIIAKRLLQTAERRLRFFAPDPKNRNKKRNTLTA